MRYAINFMNQKVEASPEVKGGVLYCPICNGDVIAKTGEINIHHFAHVTKDCGYFKYKGMSEWHTKWQDLFPPERQEVRIEKEGKVHIADVVNSDGVVIEFQHSSISIIDKTNRDVFYNKLIWVVDASSFADNLDTHLLLSEEYRNWQDKVIRGRDSNRELIGYAKEIEFILRRMDIYTDEFINAMIDKMTIQIDSQHDVELKDAKFNGDKHVKGKYLLDWKWERKIWREFKNESKDVHVFLDLGNGDMYLLDMYSNNIKAYTKEVFIKKYCH